MNKEENKVLELAGLWFKYPNGDWVLKDLNLRINRGEHVLIIGETGSGKTTLARIITGSAKLIYDGYLKGHVTINGVELRDYPEVIASHVALIGQNPYLYFTEPLVYHDLYGYALRVHGNVEGAVKALNRAVSVVGVHDLMTRYFFELSGGQAKRVLVAKALISDPLLFIFDEPLMWLDDFGVKDFINLLNMLKALQKSVIIFEHRFIPLMKHVDEIYVLKDGKLMHINKLYVAEEARSETHQSFSYNPNNRAQNNGAVLLEARGIYFKYRDTDYILRNVDFRLRRGDLVLVHGLNGQGKTTLLKILAGYLKPSRGKVVRKTDVIYVPQNVMLFYTESTIEKEVVEICKARRAGFSHVKLGLERVRRLGIDLSQPPFNLSYGQMVKLAFELARISSAEVLLLDEPFSGLTYRDRLELLKYLAESNTTAVVATSNFDAIGSSYWTKLYKLESGELVELKSADAFSLLHASKLYEEIVGAEQCSETSPTC